MNDFPVLSVGEKVAVNLGYSVSTCRVKHCEGMLVDVVAQSGLVHQCARFDVYKIPEESNRLVNDVVNHAEILVMCANRIKQDGVE